MSVAYSGAVGGTCGHVWLPQQRKHAVASQQVPASHHQCRSMRWRWQMISLECGIPAAAFASRRHVGCAAIHPEACRRQLLSPAFVSSAAPAAAVPRHRAGRSSELHATATRSPPQQSSGVDGAATAAAAYRVARLQALVELRKLYRNLIRAQWLLPQKTPVYSSAEAKKAVAGAAEEDAEQVAAKQIDAAVDIVAEMQLTSDQIRDSVRKLNIRSGYGWAVAFGSPGATSTGVGSDGSGGSADSNGSTQQQFIRQRAIEEADRLRARARKELYNLPFTSRVVAQAALDARNARFRPDYVAKAEAAEAAASAAAGGSGGQDAWDRQRSAAIERLEQAEKVAGSVAKRLPGAVQKVREIPPQDLLAGVRKSASYARGVWVRLNGGGKGSGGLRLPDGIPLPPTTKEGQPKRIAELNAHVEVLEKALQEASKAREQRLRKAGLPARARMAAELRDMDNEILILTRTLAVATLQLEMELVHGSLEDEVLDVAPDSLAPSPPTGLLGRTGTSDEVALLVAEFAPLALDLAAMTDAVARGEAELLDEDELDRLATEIPEMRTRLGIRDDQVFAGSGMSLVRLQMQFQESVGKVGEAAKFFSRGMRLLSSDVGNSGRLFMKAVFGGTLNPREVRGIRQTAKDLIVFVPFAIILIAPITPVGHVLVFGFLQRYFPGFFPSQFSGRRQAQMIKRQELQAALAQAQEAAAEEADEAEFQRASAAVSRLTQAFSPARVLQQSALVADSGRSGGWQSTGDSGGSGANGSGGVDGDGAEVEGQEGPASQRLRSLEEQVARAEAESFGDQTDDEEERATQDSRR
mmetsp:Transcript_20484/g.61660  ORF Transcript_20484/g.61660 Transcript_20484/m.61660 type:complete len:811 (-) Transcript_20484:440-2872(-)